MITFKQFLEEAKKVKPLYSKKHIEKQLKKQGGIGAKAVQKYIDKNPDRGPREYKLGEDVSQRQKELNQSQRERLQAERDRVARYRANKRAEADREEEHQEIIKRVELSNKRK
jgi:hypothetical protein